jgi:hypothetical protein
MTDTIAAHNEFEDHDRVYLERQRLAASIILELVEDAMIPDTLATELYIFRDRVDRALLLPGAAPRPGPSPDPVPASGDGDPPAV